MAKEKGIPQQQPTPNTPENAANPAVATAVGEDGTTFYAWRKDGRKPVIDEEQWKRNIHGALSPLGDADFADRHGPG